MKKFSMGMMLSSLLVFQIGCGEEAPSTPAKSPAAAIDSAKEAAGKDPIDAMKEGAGAVKEVPDTAKEGAGVVKEGADAAKEVAP